MALDTNTCETVAKDRCNRKRYRTRSVGSNKQRKSNFTPGCNPNFQRPDSSLRCENYDRHCHSGIGLYITNNGTMATIQQHSSMVPLK
uniref:Uncharacterized protein n=1 Tax=Arion vulgaris TaxID=1028688 RepID=A0A0B7A6I4_9EUPU